MTDNIQPLPLEVVKQIQDEIVRMLYKLDEICKKYDIRYWVAYGTLLGAVRHQGFIPWDDDLDVCMMREDFQKLCAVPASEWGDEFILCSPDGDEEIHDKPFGRVYIRNSTIQSYRDIDNWQNRSDGKPWSTKLLLDIFILDRIPDDDKEFDKMHKKLLVLLSKRYKLVKLRPVTNKTDIKSKTKNVLKRAYSDLANTVYKKPWRHIWDYAENSIRSHQQGKRVGAYCTPDFDKYDYDDIYPLDEAKFGDMIVPVPRNWDQMLKDLYGDYMKPPAEKDRGHLDLVYCDFGNGKVMVLDPVPGSKGEGMQKNV